MRVCVSECEVRVSECVYSGATMKHVIVLRVYCSAAVDAADANCILHFQSNSSRPLIRASVCIYIIYAFSVVHVH